MSLSVHMLILKHCDAKINAFNIANVITDMIQVGKFPVNSVFAFPESWFLCSWLCSFLFFLFLFSFFATQTPITICSSDKTIKNPLATINSATGYSVISLSALFLLQNHVDDKVVVTKSFVSLISSKL